MDETVEKYIYKLKEELLKDKRIGRKTLEYILEDIEKASRK